MAGLSDAWAHSTDAELAARTREGDPDALAALYERFAGTLMRLAYHTVGSAADAEDVLHDVFLGLPEALERYEERGNLEAWLKRVTTRMALTHLRSRDRKREVAFAPHDEPSVSSDERAIAGRIVLARALRALPDSLRVVFVLKQIEGYTHQEIGELLGIRVGTSQVRFHRAVKRLQKLIRSEL